MRTVPGDHQTRRTARRLGLQAGSLMILLLVAVALVQWTLVERSAGSAARSRLSDVTKSIDRPREAPRDVLVTIDGPDGVRSSRDLPTGLPVRGDLALVRRTGQTHERSLSLGGHEYLVRTARAGDRVIQAELDRQPIEDESRRLIAALVYAGLIGVLLAAAMAYWLARRAMTPMAETMALQRRFVADAGHELRTPLTLLSTRVQLLSRRLRGNGAELRADADGVLADTNSLTEILEELLLAADTRQTPERELRELAVLAGEAVESAHAEARERGLVLGLDVTGSTTVAVSVTAVRRAVLAMVDNALDHAAARVDVRVHRSGRRVVVSVHDDGPGIDPQLIPRMFDRFASTREAAATDGRRHYGLGLALVADVAGAHGGRVFAANSPAGGAVISLELPARR